MTSGLFPQHALCTAIACAMYGLGDTGYAPVKMLAALSIGALLLTMDAQGFSVDTVMANKAQSAIALGLGFIAFVN